MVVDLSDKLVVVVVGDGDEECGGLSEFEWRGPTRIMEYSETMSYRMQGPTQSLMTLFCPGGKTGFSSESETYSTPMCLRGWQ